MGKKAAQAKLANKARGSRAAQPQHQKKAALSGVKRAGGQGRADASKRPRLSGETGSPRVNGSLHGADGPESEAAAPLGDEDRAFFSRISGSTLARLGANIEHMSAAKTVRRDEHGRKLARSERERLVGGAKRSGDEEDGDESEEGEYEAQEHKDADRSGSSDEEADYEKRPRTANHWARVDRTKLLPIKLPDGRLVQREKPEGRAQKSEDEARRDNEEDQVYDSDTGGDEDSDGDRAEVGDGEEVRVLDGAMPAAPAAGASIPKLSAEELEQRRRIRVERLKVAMALAASNVLSNPEANIGELKEVLALMDDSDAVVQQLALLTLVEVFKDIVPSYRIRLPTEAELRAQVSKEVRQLRAYETALLNGYRQLLSRLATLGRAIFRQRTKKALSTHPQLGTAVVESLAQLLERCHHFNFRKDLVQAAVPLLTCWDSAARARMLRSVEALFDSDVSGDTTLEIVKLISLIVKKRGRKVREEMLLCLLRLRFDEEQGRGSAMVERGGAPVEERKSEREREREREKEKARALEANRKHKKKWKRMSKEETRELQRDLAEGEGEVRPEYKKIVFTAVVSELFTIYFRYLKDEPNARVLPVVLQGLAKFSHLVNIELVLDMLEFLKELMTTNISTDSKLNCVLAAFRTLRTHADAITIDLKDFFACLFALLWDFADPARAASIPALFTCLELMFNSRYNVPLERVASFVKRLCVIAASMTPSCALGVLHQVRLILRTYPTATKLLDIESSASGAFLAEVDDPDVCNAFATTAWEVAALTMSYHPFLRDYAQSLLAEEQTELVRVPARTLLLHYDASHGEFNPPLKPPGALSNKALKKMRLMRKLRARSGLESDFVQQLRERLSPPRA